MTLVQGRDGKLNGTASQGGTSRIGTVFGTTTGGTLTTLQMFRGGDGSEPNAGLVVSLDGPLYGTTLVGGTSTKCPGGCGAVFKVTPGGKLTTLYSFTDGTDGANPFAALVQGTDGNFYGTTQMGGDLSSCSLLGCGTVFKITPSGTLTTLHIFEGSDGSFPVRGLIQATDGNFYGTTTEGGTTQNFICLYGCGTIFKIAPAGVLTTVHNFEVKDGAGPEYSLIQATDGNFYGTTDVGGDVACDPPTLGCGTVFKMTPEGKLTTLHIFELTDGAYPLAGLVQGTDGNFYGTTGAGGSNEDGATIFQISSEGTFKIVYNFCSQLGCVDGCEPKGGLVQATNGIFYGATYFGGTYGDGTIYSLDMGLGPFVSFVRAAGKVGETGPILGQGLTGTTSVSINGIQAEFMVISDTDIRATVPEGATTGYVKVTTPTGVLTSNVPFQVIP